MFDSQFKGGNIELARAAKQCMEECDYLIEDVSKAVAGMEHAFLSGQSSPSNKDLKKLIKHDHEVIQMVTKGVNMANSSEHSIATGEGNPKQLILQTTQMISSCRGFFGARANVLAGLKQKKAKKAIIGIHKNRNFDIIMTGLYINVLRKECTKYRIFSIDL